MPDRSIDHAVARNSGSRKRGPSGSHPSGTRVFEELDDVALAAPVHVASLDRDLHAGARGTIVGVWERGRAYEVEFSEPFACLVTMPAAGLRS